MSHPFGDLVKQSLSRKHGLSQAKLAQGILQPPSVLSDMMQGRRLSGIQSRQRVLAIIDWLHQQDVLHNIVEAEALLAAAGMAGFRSEDMSDYERFIFQRLTPLSGAPLQPVRPEQSLLSIESLTLNTPSQIHLGSIPPLPSLIVGREKDLLTLKHRLGIGNQKPTALHVLTAIRGWPGVGKTALVAALAHDPEILHAFPDGVLWASLGQQPGIFVQLIVWSRALGLPTQDITTIEEASMRLAAVLRTKRMLLIVDDVWEATHVEPFRIGGSGCALLITTGLPEVARAVAPTAQDVYVLGVLAEEDALELLRRLAPEVVAEHPELSRDLVNDLEGLPLALQVAGRLLHAEASYGFGIADLVREIREGARLIMEQAPADRRDLVNETMATVAALLKQSTDRLDPQALDCFAYLGAFAPKPATFDPAAMAAVWHVDDPKPMIRTLVNRGLLEPINGRFWMHSLLVSHARSLLSD